MPFLLKSAYLALTGDQWRGHNPFSEDMTAVHDVLFHPFASDRQKSKALLLWMKRYQPCVFGRIAAQMERLHVCLLSETDMYLSDEEIKDFIQMERVLWKQRCFRNESPEHGFLLIAALPRLALGSPNNDLYEFSKILRDLYAAEMRPDLKGNDIAWEYLYIQHPETKKCYRFRFSLDYFAAQGDKRWWHDHRIPGGVAYTANSIGHMARTREWYEEKGNQTEWAVKVAMETVDEGAQTHWGKAIKLRELQDGQPFSGIMCPFKSLTGLKPRLQGRDWSAYEGTLSTDHSLRREMFREAPDAPDTLPRWNMDFTYLYDEKNDALNYFMAEGELSPCKCITSR